MRTFLIQLISLALSLSPLPLCAVSTQFPMGSIPHLHVLDNSNFRQRFPGTPLLGNEQFPEGHYIVYTHQQLLHLWGPETDGELAQFYYQQLQDIVAQVVDKRPSLASHQLVLLQLPQDASLLQQLLSKAEKSPGQDPIDPEPPATPLPPEEGSESASEAQANTPNQAIPAKDNAESEPQEESPSSAPAPAPSSESPSIWKWLRSIFGG